MKKNSTGKVCVFVRLAAIQLLLLLLFTSVTMASSRNDNQVLEQQLTIDLTDASFEQALKQIAEKAEVKFVYSVNVLNVTREKVSVHAANVKLGELLDRILGPLNITYNVYELERSITLKKISIPDDHEKRGMNTSDKERKAQYLELLITGKVIDKTSQSPIAGVNIIIKGTTNGTTTNSTGEFRLEANPGDRLVISFIGYKSQEILLGDELQLTITMEEDVSSLDEVVVNAGYWEVSKKEQTGNISKVSAVEIFNQPVSNSLQAIQGRMAGVYVQQTSGVAGGGFNISIRGQNSIRNNAGSSGNLPLYIVDGVPFTSSYVGSLSLGNSISPLASPLSMINPNDIQSIEVLKDADATAIYGSRGSNGVVLITTKKATKSDTQFDVSFQTGFARVAHRLDLLSSPQYNRMRREAFSNEGYESDLVPANAPLFPDILMWDTTRYTDWQKELIGGTARTTNGQLSVSGGNDRTRFILGTSVYNETTVFPGDFAYTRASGHFNINHTSLNGKFSINFSTNYSNARNKLPAADLTSLAVTLAPVAPALYNDNGALNWENNSWNNPMAFLTRKYQTRSENLITNTLFTYKIADGLTFKTNAGYTSMTTGQLATIPIKSNRPSFGITTGQSDFATGRISTWIVEPQLQWRKQVGSGNIEILTGATLQENRQENQTTQASGFTTDALLENAQAAPITRMTGASYSQYKYAALFARAFYSFRDKYIVNLTGRRDGSSRFGPGKKFANFGAIGAAWIFSEEDFIKSSLPFLSFGKIRSSFGITGSDQIGDYQYLASYSATQYPYAGSNGLIPNRLVNPDYAWETNQKIEVGFDAAFLRDRIQIGISWFRNQSGNQLVGYPLPTITGQSSIQYNLDATVENKGVEVEILSQNINTPTFTWTTSLNLTIPRNRLVSYPNLSGSPYANSLTVGKSLYTRKLIHGTGVDPLTGLYQFEDVNGNGITLSDVPGDLQALKELSQRSYGGVSNTFRIKSVELSFLFQFVKQTGRSYIGSFSQQPGADINQPAIVMNRWQNPGDITDIQKFALTPPGGGNAYLNAAGSSDNIITDASFIRLRNASVAWVAPTRLASALKLNSARIFVNGQNLWTITNYLGFDPETQSSSTLPPLRMVNIGIQVSF